MPFLTILNEQVLKKYICDQNHILDIERGTLGLTSLKISATASVDHDLCVARFLKL